ncbi:MAG TPA: VWA domain-containing protein [Syntrophales bacterium]|nr:VWA domain-containing protein [Syntrophales bacterium]
MVKILQNWLTVAALCLIYSSVSAADVITFRARQAVARHPEIKVYIDALGPSGLPVDAPSAGQLFATVGQIQADIKDIKRFDQLGEGVGYVFLVDISRSLSSGQFDQMKAAINLWVEKMRDTDRMAIISFGEKVTTVQDYTGDKNALKNGVKALAMSDNKTQLHQGIAKAIETSHRIDTTLPSRRVIVMLSDGEDDFPGGMTRDEVLAKMTEDRVPVYVIGFLQRGVGKDENLKALGEFARTSGGEFFDGNRAVLGKLYESIQQKILKSFLVKLDATKAIADGKSYRLQLTLSSSGKIMTDGLDLRIFPHTGTTPEKTLPQPWYNAWHKKISVWGYAAAGCFLVLVIALFIKSRQKKAARLRAEEEEHKREVAEQEAAQKKAAAEAAARVEEEKKKIDDQLTVRKSQAPGLKMKLSVLGNSADRRDYGIILSNQAFIGRSSECDLSIRDDEEISKRHCKLTIEGGYVMISDLNSTNGTFVNGVPIKSDYRLKSGDLVLLGRTEMRITF